MRALLALREEARDILWDLRTIHSDLVDSFDALEAGLELIQADSINELKTALNATSEDTAISLLRDAIAESQGSLGVLTIHKILFLLLANVYNRADDKGEKVTQIQHSESFDTGSTFVDKIMNRGVAAIVIDPVSGERKRISPIEMIGHIVKVADRVGIKIDTAYINTIIESQKEAMQIIADKRPYTAEEGMRYRENTIKKYAHILGSILYPKHNKLRDRVVLAFLEIQKYDDKHDMSEDLNSQMNPYIGIIYELGLYNHYKRFLESGLTRLDDFCLNLDPEMEKLLSQRISQIDELYESI